MNSVVPLIGMTLPGPGEPTMTHRPPWRVSSNVAATSSGLPTTSNAMSTPPGTMRVHGVAHRAGTRVRPVRGSEIRREVELRPRAGRSR